MTEMVGFERVPLDRFAGYETLRGDLGIKRGPRAVEYCGY